GLMGAGRSELARTLAGILEPTTGRIELDGRPVRLRGIAQAISAKIAYLPAERHTEGLFPEASIADNVIAATLEAFARFGLLDRRKRDRTSADKLRQLKVKVASVSQPVASLSGGNQQKVLLARWLLTAPRVLIVEEPTRGIDIGAKLEIYDLLGRLADGGTAILVVSSDPPEIIALCDRTLVMHAGRIAGELTRKMASEERIMRLAAGLRNAA
ncbi:MAG: ATP-binding cassette domain-containing protein, partial [Geminicoccaceae bacterium]